MRIACLLPLAGLGALMTGCIIVHEDRPGEGFECADYARESIALNVVDERGARVCDATVVVRGAGVEQRLEPVGPPGACAWYGLPERAGTFEVTVSKPGYETAVERNVVVAMERDGCHVESARVDVALEPEFACTEIALPSLRGTVRDEQGRPICDAQIVARDGAFQQTLTLFAAPGGACEFSGVPERPGTYEVTVSKPGYETERLANVVVGRDPTGCHVKTVTLDVVLDAGAQACDERLVEPFDLDIRDPNLAEVCDARVLVFEGTRPAGELVPVLGPGGDCAWTGGPDRAGAYRLVVTKPGFLTAEVNPVVSLDATGCHVEPVLVNVSLQPEIALP